MAASQRDPAVLWALNDGGNPATLYALSRSGATLREFPIRARNRDWEDLASVRWHGEAWLLIADIGDNRARHEHSFIHLLREPSLSSPGKTLEPALTVRFTYSDGPQDAESFAVTDDAMLILTKPSARADGRQRSSIHVLPKPSAELLLRNSLGASNARVVNLGTRRSGTFALPSMNLEAKFIAAVSGVDVRQPTALDINDGDACVLSYRTIRCFRRQPGQDWEDALSSPAERATTHSLRQSEALALMDDGRVWFTTESVSPPLWVWRLATRHPTERRSPPP